MAIAQNPHSVQPTCLYDLGQIEGLFEEKPKGI